MALKSKEWFYKQCLVETRGFTRLAHLAFDILNKGIGGHDRTRGHVTQAIGATQRFLEGFPRFRRAIQSSDPTRPFDIRRDQEIAREWRRWFQRRRGGFGRQSFGYNFNTLRSYLPPTLAGSRRGGGGGGDELKRVLRLMAEFTGRRRR